MAKHIIKFSKKDSVKYVSHLDIVRMFGRAMRRAGLFISFSKGFNPHPIMNFAHPLGVGISSDSELVEIGVEGDISSKEILEKLSVKMPEGFELLAAKPSDIKSPFAPLSYAEYRIEFFGEKPETDKFMAMDKIIIEKKTKSGVKETDIRPLIKCASVAEVTDDCSIIYAVLKCGDPNLKPELFVNALEKSGCGKAGYFKIKRTALLNEEEKPLIDFQE